MESHERGGNSGSTDPALHCPECRSHLVTDNRRGETVCADCGLVVDEGVIDPGPDWREFEGAATRSRTGAPTTPTLHDRGLTTYISWPDRDAHGRSIPPTQRAQFHRLRRWQRRLRISGSAERNLSQALADIDRLASRMGLPRDVREAAAEIYRRALRKGLTRGRATEGMAATSLYSACRQCGVPRTLDEVAAATRYSRRDIGRMYRALVHGLGFRAPPDAEDYAPRICHKLGLSSAVETAVLDIIRRAEEAQLTSGYGPAGTVAAAIYIADRVHGERRTQRKIAEKVRVTEATIRTRYKELTEGLGIALPPR